MKSKLRLPPKIRNWYNTEAEKLRGMSFKKKLEYIFGYYWGWMLLFLIFLMFCGYVGDVIVQSRKEIVLEGFFTNDDYNLFPANQIKKDYSSTLSLAKNQTLLFDDTLYVSMDGTATEYTAASNGKIIAYMATQELDFVVTTEAVYEHYVGNVPMAGLDTALTPKLAEQLQDRFIPGVDPDGNASFTGLDMTQSRFIAGVGADEDENISERYILFIPYSAPHMDMVNDFISWSFS